MNLVHTVVTLGWVEKYVDNYTVVNIDGNGKSTYPPWSEMNDLSTAFPAQSADGAKYAMRDNEGESM